MVYFEDIHKKASVENPLWIAPENLETAPADVYSFGIILYELASLTVPFSEHQFAFTFQLQEAIQSGLRPSAGLLRDAIPPVFLSLMEQCWSSDPQARPSFAEIVPILSSLLSDSIL